MANQLEVIKTHGNFDLIKVAEGQYCVRKRFKTFWLKKPKQKFMVLNRIGTTFTFDELAGYITIDSLERCEYVFNANVLMEGAL